MTINLKEKAVKGATVHFRCGGTAVAENVADAGYISFSFEGMTDRYMYQDDGSFNPDNIHPLDIIRIDPPAFDWSTAKAGMAFTDNNGKDYWFMCHDWEEKENAWFSPYSICSRPTTLVKSELVHKPEHDIEVK